MEVAHGEILTFADYLEQTARTAADAVVWKCSDIQLSLTRHPHNVQGTLALAGGGTADRASIAPGLSLVIQVLNPGETTKPHRHSFWHLYIARSGSGEASLGDNLDRRRIAEGDILFVPAWCMHAISNPAGHAPLVLLRLQNLPQNASLGTLAREDDGLLTHIYAGTTVA